MSKALAKLDDHDLRSLIGLDVDNMQRTDLPKEQRRLLERRYAICISEAIRRIRQSDAFGLQHTERPQLQFL